MSQCAASTAELLADIAADRRERRIRVFEQAALSDMAGELSADMTWLADQLADGEFCDEAPALLALCATGEINSAKGREMLARIAARVQAVARDYIQTHRADDLDRLALSMADGD